MVEDGHSPSGGVSAHSLRQESSRRHSEGGDDQDGALSPRVVEFAVHLGMNLKDPVDSKLLWVPKQAVSEALPDGWSQVLYLPPLPSLLPPRPGPEEKRRRGE